jgi:hypothetical protein
MKSRGSVLPLKRVWFKAEPPPKSGPVASRVGMVVAAEYAPEFRHYLSGFGGHGLVAGAEDAGQPSPVMKWWHGRWYRRWWRRVG